MTDDVRIITSWEKIDELQTEAQFVPTIRLDSTLPTLDQYLGTKYVGTPKEKHLGAFHGGHLVIISGDEGEGKSSFARSLTKYFQDQKGVSLWFSFEERSDEFMEKFEEEVPYFLLPAVLEMSVVSWVHKSIKEAKKKYGKIHAVFIDHLHYLTDEVETGNLSNDLGRICRKLKLIGVAENLIMVLVCHTNRNESAEEPTIRSLRDSGMIGKEADTVIFIWRNADDTACAKVAKCRLTGTKNKIVFIEKKGPFMYEYNKPAPHVGFHADRLQSRGRNGED